MATAKLLETIQAQLATPLDHKNKNSDEEALVKAGEYAIAGLLGQIADLNSLMVDHFQEKPSELRKKFKTAISESKFFQNEPLIEIKENIEDLTSTSLDMLNDLSLWIQLLVPKIEDGGNFGVAVQLEFVKRVGGRKEAVSKLFGDIAAFHEKRAGLAEKLSAKMSKESRTVNVTKAEKDKEAGTTVTQTETMSESEVHPEQLDALVSLDLKLFLQMKESVRNQRDFLLTLSDFLRKNEKRLKNPKGIMSALPGFII